MATRCDDTDLLTAECAHCTGATLDDPKPPRMSAVIEATYASFCGHCDAPYPAGSDIALGQVAPDRREWCIADHTAAT